MLAEKFTQASAKLHPDYGRKPLAQFYMAASLYLLWSGLIWLSIATGQLSIAPEVGVLMLAGVAATNALFFGIARAAPADQPPAPAVTALQCLFGLFWAALFTYFVPASGATTLAMFITCMLYTLFQVSSTSFRRLALISAAAYSAAIVLRYLTVAQAGPFWSEGVQLITYLGVMGWLTLFAGHIHSLREELHDRNEQLRENIRKVARVAERDHLTKSFNRHYIMDTLAREKGRADRSNYPVSIAIFDLDHFKRLNDEHGHLVGDRVLKVFAKRVRAELRGMDAINPSDNRRSFGRFGGEEFIAILPGTNLSGAESCAERLRENVAGQPIDDAYQITVSVGVAEYRRGETVPEMLARADEALYLAKSRGRNRVEVSDPKPATDAEVIDFRSAGS